jgi:hypothetical protein
MDLAPQTQEFIGWFIGIIAVLAGVTASAEMLIRGALTVFSRLDPNSGR